ncbi:MAG TPA: tRNA 4-thiouridine(8) synthase ThiI, partial [Spirochaetia bacterium]|nr:tRNA 4-thiouridine(8) synthase ThiI [Spirochaetia bacterium]
MSDILFLVKYGEIALKKRNRGAFIKRLKDSIHERLPDLRFEVTDTFQRVFVKCSEQDREAVSAALARTFGIVSFCETLRVPAE